ncbi:MAG: SGNH/GDSL hydrolase family protein [Lachnospiraceae bacterium]|nr:SGNH/GDSL hydrolase family protein [Lachnospiraceae bacterium]
MRFGGGEDWGETMVRKGVEEMRKREFSKQKIFYVMAAWVLFCILFITTFRSRADHVERQTVELVVFGDSVMGEIRDETAVPVQLEALTGKSIYNAALGGTSMARQGTEGRAEEARDCLSLAGLAKAVWAEDFGVQKAIKIRESNTEYFPMVLDGLDKIDFTQVEIILIQQGLNDFHGGTPLENPQAPYDEHTFLGALRSAVLVFRKMNPAVRIVLVTPTYTWYPDRGVTCEELDYGGGVMEDYVEAEMRAAKELGIEVIDVYHDFFPHEVWEDWQRYSRDGIHPNEAGREKLALKIAEVLEGADERGGIW